LIWVGRMIATLDCDVVNVVNVVGKKTTKTNVHGF
jgi:hypothetical protein